MARPSPRTVGCAKRDPRTGECLEGQEFQRFGTSQLIKDPDAYMGVRAVVPPSVDPFGGMLKGVFGSPTVRNTAYPDLTITGAVESGLKQPLTPFEFPSNGNGEECDLGCLLTGRGCDCGCKDVKPCTTCDSTVCKECNAWDLQCEDCKKKDGTCTPPLSEDCGCMPYDFGCEIGCWWEKNKNYVYLLGGLIGLGVLLWLLRPLFGFAKSVTEVSKSAVTKVNGLK